MPVAPRPRGKAKKIAYDILGVPPNMQSTTKRGSADRREERLVYEMTMQER